MRIQRLNGISRLALGVAAFAMLAAACGGDDSGSKASKTTAPAGNAADTSMSTIRIGTQGEFSGFSASSNAGSADMAKAWQKWVNKTQGGIKGHPVSVDVVDDAGDSAKGLAAFKGFVNNDKIIAMVSGGSTGTITAISPYAIQKGVPIITGDNYLPVHIGSPMVFPLNLTIPALLAAPFLIAKERGLKKVGQFACAESPACDTDALSKLISSQLGVAYGGLQKVAFDAPNYTAQCLAMKKAGVDFLVMGTSSQGAIKMIADCQKQGYDPTFDVQMTTWDTNIAKLKTAKIVGNVPSVPFYSDDPLAAPMKEAWNDFGPGGDIPSQQAAITFQALEFFRKQASTITSANPTAADMVAALGKVTDDNLGGVLANKLTWTAGQKAGPPNFCYFIAENQMGTLKEDLTAHCSPPIKLS